MKKILFTLFILFSIPCFADRTIPYPGGQFIVVLSDPVQIVRENNFSSVVTVSEADKKSMDGITAGKKIDCVYSGRYTGAALPDGAGSASAVSVTPDNKTIHVNAYTRQDGTQVREHFRAAAGSKN